VTTIDLQVRSYRNLLAVSFLAALVFLGAGRVAAQESFQAAAPVAQAHQPMGATAPETTGPPGGEETRAKNDDEEKEQAEDASTEKKKVGFVGLPIPIANPTLQQGLALVGAALYHLGEDAPASLTGVGAMYTSTESWGYGLVQKIYTSHDRWRITAGAIRFKLNLRFYGIGENAGAKDSHVPFTLDGKAYGAEVLHALGKNTYLGLGYIFFSNTTIFTSNENLPEIPFFDLTFNQSVALLTLPFQWDTRDNILNPKRGNYLKLTATFSDEAIGSDFTYQQYRFGFSHYAHLNDRMILAVRGTACDTQNRAPFYRLCTLGSGDGLRGFPVEVYWRRSSAAAVAEWRWSFAGRWGVIAFAGTGATGRGITELNLDNLVPSYGVGIRFMMAKDYGVNIGLDYGRSNDRDAIYFRVGEAF